MHSQNKIAKFKFAYYQITVNTCITITRNGRNLKIELKFKFLCLSYPEPGPYNKICLFFHPAEQIKPTIARARSEH